MDANASPWAGRRVLVTGCDEFLGGAVSRELLARGATIVAFVRDRSWGAEYVREIAASRFHLIRGDYRDTARLHAAMVVHEVSTVFHFAEREHSAIHSAAKLYHSRVPIICSRSSRLLPLAGDGTLEGPLFGVIRFDQLFGPGDRDTSRPVTRTVLGLLAGQTQLPSSGVVRDYVFIRDAAFACIELAEAVGRAGHALDRTVRSGWEFTEPQLGRILANAVAGSLPDLPAFADAIRETIEWYRQLAASIVSPLARPRRRAA